jgi:glycine/D-amino acid oxidase-like deaminating enzyme/nitrite reductase/ring-hydroxylating ferredoxin subunit
MDTLSLWRDHAPAGGFAMLDGALETEVLVVGGGITGTTLALLLAQQGRKVVLLEAGEIGSGATGHSTGNLYVTTSAGLRGIAVAWSPDVAQQVVTERAAAIDFIESHARLAPECGFRRCELRLGAMVPSYQDHVDEERRTLMQAGCAVRMDKAMPAPLPQPFGEVLVLADQAQFQPQAYVAHLARQAAQAGASIHEHSRVLELDARNKVATTAGGTVRAQEIVLATHTPKGFHLVQAEMPVNREYGIAWPLAADPGPGIFWSRGDEGLSVRTATGADGRAYMVCVGQGQKVGAHNAKAALMALEAMAEKHLGAAVISHRWSAQNYRSADGLPYIGRDASGLFVATGFATDGLTWGTVAARVLLQLVEGGAHEFGELCKPSRLSPIAGGKTILEETVATAVHFVKDYFTHRQEQQLTSLAAGDSAIIEVEGESFAAYRAPDGELFAVSSVCTHMGCKVHWNSVETSWDCPCHGSRFRPDGTVIEGPALAPLARKQLPLGQEETPAAAAD